MFLICIVLCSYFITCSESSVFCYGRLLHEVQTNNIFKDPRTFLRLRMLKPENEILRDFANLDLNELCSSEKKKVIQVFLEKNFANTSGLEHWSPDDFRRKPKFLNNIYDFKLKKFLIKLNEDWLRYGRKLAKDVYNNSSVYSLITVPHPFFVASHNDEEMGYWESYWIFKGLMACEMFNSAKFLLENILRLIRDIGYCPPYNRIYFRGRLSPPLLALMMDEFVRATNSTEFLHKNLPLIDIDFAKWMENRASILTSPFHSFLVVSEDNKVRLRPESYPKDLSSLHRTAEPKRVGPKELFWTSNRNIDVVSVTDCCITARAGRLISGWLRDAGHKARARYLQEVSEELNYTIHTLLKVGDCWRDLHLQNGFRSVNWWSKWPVWSGLAESGCDEGPYSQPNTGPEALVAGYPASHEWLASFYSSPRRSLVDSASALTIAASSASRHHIAVRVRKVATSRPKLAKYILYPMVFYLAARLFELFTCLVVGWCSVSSTRAVGVTRKNVCAEKEHSKDKPL